MTDRQSGDANARPSTGYSVGVAVVFAGVLWAGWTALVGQLDAQDIVGGAVAAGAGVLLGWLVSVRGRALPQFRPHDLVTVIGLFPRFGTETCTVFAATWRRALGRGEPSGTRTVATDVTGGAGWRSARRSGVVAALLSATPATIVIDIDAETGEATVHDFVRRDADEAAS